MKGRCRMKGRGSPVWGNIASGQVMQWGYIQQERVPMRAALVTSLLVFTRTGPAPRRVECAIHHVDGQIHSRRHGVLPPQRPIIPLLPFLRSRYVGMAVWSLAAATESSIQASSPVKRLGASNDGVR